MTLQRLLLSLSALIILAGTAFLAREEAGPGQKMTAAAETFMAALDAVQKKKVGFAFDDKERYRWFFTPQQRDKKSTRKGLPLSEMNDAQQKLARSLLASGTSESGYKKATTVMSLESILADLEKKGTIVRDPQWYFFSVFGTPSKGRWGWRVEGHHLSLNFTVEGGKIVSATPFFLGSNPAEVKGGLKRGLTALPESIADFKAMLTILDGDGRKAAKQAKLFADIEEAKPKTNVGAPVGLRAVKMTGDQKAGLRKLIGGYASRMPPEVAKVELDAIDKAGFDNVTFAFAGSEAEEGKPYTYRVQGPTFVIEFVNEQRDSAGNTANHIHSSWRAIEGDFGLAAK